MDIYINIWNLLFIFIFYFVIKKCINKFNSYYYVNNQHAFRLQQSVRAKLEVNNAKDENERYEKYKKLQRFLVN